MDAPVVVLAPDKFKGSLTAPQVVGALAAGIVDVAPHWTIREAPVADGGEGTVDAVVAAGWDLVHTVVRGPLGAPIAATYARHGGTALIEMAGVAGLGMLPEGRPWPLDASTVGVGDLVAHALDHDSDRVIVGLGGSASTDGGAGLLVGLGARILDDAGEEIPAGGRGLPEAARVDLRDLHPRALTVPIVFAGDVDSPLCGPTGAAAVYGPQKGADPEQVSFLDAALGHWARLLRAAFGPDVENLDGAGAAGGALCGAAAVLGATRERGVHTVLQLVDFDEALRGADLVVTGEGCLDHQTLEGKAPIGVLEVARAAGAPVIAVAGACALSDGTVRAAGFREVHTLVALAPDRESAVRDAATLLRCVGRTIATSPPASRRSR